jgi:hypothetical protein
MKILLIFFLLPLRLLAQDITGVWTGTLYSDTTKQYLKYELAISENSRKLSGYSYTIFLIDSVENIGVKSIKIKKSGNGYFVEDDKLIDNNYIEPPAKGVKTYSNLILTETDSNLTLSGPWKTNRTNVFESITGNILLHKKKKIHETLIIPKLEKLGLAKSLSFMQFDNYSKQVTITNKLPISQETSKIPEQNVEKNNSQAENNSKNSAKKEEIHSEEKQPSLVANLNKIDTTEQKKVSINNQIPAKDSALDKKRDTAFSNNNIVIARSNTEKNINKNKKEIPQQVAETPMAIQPKKNISQGSSITTETDENKIEKNNQLITTKSLSNIKEPIHADAPPVIKAAAEISLRKIETVRSVNIKNDSLLLTLYDNGEIDGDTVSVLMNGKVIMPMQGLTAKGISKTIYLTPEMGDSVELIMYAENLGSIPPNTGLLVVHDGNAIY